MASDDKITGTIKFILEQMDALEKNQFNGIFMVELGYKNGGIATTSTAVKQLRRGDLPTLFMPPQRKK